VTAEQRNLANGRVAYWYSQSEKARASDVLIREGYLPEYPANPFAKTQDRAQSVLAMQRDVRTSITGNDPLRPGTAEAAIYGTRFGAEGRLMGQVLCDPRFAQWQYIDGQTGAVEEHDTWANIEYQFWDMWLDPQGREPYLPFSPGQFFYKGAGDIRLLNGNQGVSRPLPPENIRQYILGVYGSLRTKGHDVLGEEPIIHFAIRTEPQSETDDELSFEYTVIELHPWTRSQLEAEHKQGSPYEALDDYLLPGNRNGLRDGIVLGLVSES
jgi:hypothetical protein